MTICFRIVKYTIYALLGLNLIFFIRGSPLSAALDSLGWLILLGVFEFETGQPSDTYAARWHGWLILAVQGLAYALVFAALYRYCMERDWLDCANTVLWLLVVLSLAYDVYTPGPYGALEWRMRNLTKITLYSGLAAIAISWALRHEILDFYDATLWIVCFLVVECNVFDSDRPTARNNRLVAQGTR